MSKSFSKFPGKHPWWSAILRGISGLLYKNWTLPRMFFEIYSASLKLHIVFCIIILPVVSNFFLAFIRKEDLCCILYLQPYKCVLKMAALKPLKSFQNYFRVDVNHIWWTAGVKCGTKSVLLTPAFPITMVCRPCVISNLVLINKLTTEILHCTTFPKILVIWPYKNIEQL